MSSVRIFNPQVPDQQLVYETLRITAIKKISERNELLLLIVLLILRNVVLMIHDQFIEFFYREIYYRLI